MNFKLKNYFWGRHSGECIHFHLLLQVVWRKRLNKARGILIPWLSYLKYVGNMQCMLVAFPPCFPLPWIILCVMSHTEDALLCMPPLLHARLFHNYCWYCLWLSLNLLERQTLWSLRILRVNSAEPRSVWRVAVPCFMASEWAKCA